MHELDLMLRSTNTASGTQVQGREEVGPGAVSELAALLREEVTRIHQAKAAEARSQVSRVGLAGSLLGYQYRLHESQRCQQQPLLQLLALPPFLLSPLFTQANVKCIYVYMYIDDCISTSALPTSPAPWPAPDTSRRVAQVPQQQS